MSRSEHLQAVVPSPHGWSPASWRERSALQQPTYADADALAGVLGELHALPPLVTSREVMNLKQQLAEAQEGKRFLLQGGDCAESFSDCTPEVIDDNNTRRRALPRVWP